MSLAVVVAVQDPSMLVKIQGVVAQGFRGLCAARPNSGKTAGPVCIVLLSLLLEACARPSVHEPVTLTLLEEWTTKTFSEGRQQELEQFTRETGIRVKLLPSPEAAREKLALWRELLRTGASGPDVYGIDVIWPWILNEDFIDLKPYFANEISLQFPAIAASYTVDNKLVAMAYRADIGLLFYRTDLLQHLDIVSHPGPGMSWRLWRLGFGFRRANEPKVKKTFGALCGKEPLPKR
jgi:ABC-type glycerol-3-phosphate transport system substrate-binding protein